jgi:hypothetical protein
VEAQDAKIEGLPLLGLASGAIVSHDSDSDAELDAAVVALEAALAKGPDISREAARAALLAARQATCRRGSNSAVLLNYRVTHAFHGS